MNAALVINENKKITVRYKMFSVVRKIVLVFGFAVLLTLNAWAEAQVSGIVEQVLDDNQTIIVNGEEYLLPEGLVEELYITVGDDIILYFDENNNIYDVSFLFDDVQVEDN